MMSENEMSVEIERQMRIGRKIGRRDKTIGLIFFGLLILIGSLFGAALFST